MEILGGGGGKGRGENIGHFFAGYVQQASQNLSCILAYVVANYRPHLFPLLGKTGMEWEPFINIKIR